MRVKPFNKETLFFKPVRGSKHAAAYDLFYTGHPFMLCAGERNTAETNLVMEIPEGYYGRIAGRSGLASKGLDVLGGVIDSDYRGEIKVLLVNLSGSAIPIAQGDKVAQIIIEKYYDFPIEVVNDLSHTDRGAAGFGSTDVTQEMAQKLREATNCGILQCKHALQATGGDISKAIQYLRCRGIT